MAIFAPTDAAPIYRPTHKGAGAHTPETRHGKGNITDRARRVDAAALAEVGRAARERTYRTPRLMMPGR